jgi:hypothetical protein
MGPAGHGSGLAILIGSVGSVALTLYAGRHNPSYVLRTIFALWVLVPFVAAIAIASSPRWDSARRGPLFDGVLGLLTVASLGIYSWTVFGPPRPRMASVFLITPALSLAVLMVTALLARWGSGHLRRGSRTR